MDFSNMIVFNERLKGGGNLQRSTKDVSVSVCSPSHGNRNSERFQIIFRNDVHQLICPDIERLSYACVLNYILFKQSDNGYKLCVQKNSSNRCVQFTAPDKTVSRQMHNMIGDYDLKLDDNTGLYYIEKEIKS